MEELFKHVRSLLLLNYALTDVHQRVPGFNLDAELREDTEEGSSALQIRRGDQDQDVARLSENVSRTLSIRPDTAFFGMSWCV